MNVQAVRIVISGMVQGVGYRYFAYRAATNLGLAGWVCNRPDGAVEIEAEGDHSLLEALIDDLKVGPRSAVVKGVDVKWLPTSGKHKSFEVRF